VPAGRSRNLAWPSPPRQRRSADAARGAGPPLPQGEGESHTRTRPPLPTPLAGGEGPAHRSAAQGLAREKRGRRPLPPAFPRPNPLILLPFIRKPPLRTLPPFQPVHTPCHPRRRGGRRIHRPDDGGAVVERVLRATIESGGKSAAWRGLR